MRSRRIPVTAAVAVLVGVTGGTAGMAGTAHADIPGSPPLTHYSHMVADGAHHHLFISGGLGSGSIAVTDFDGNAVGSVPAEPNASSMALSPDGGTLYVALPGNNAVSAVDTATLKETARYSTGAADDPSHVAYAGGRIWFGYGGPAAGGLGSIDTSGATPVVTLTPGTWYAAPVLAAGPGAPNTLVAADPGLSPSAVRVYDVSGATPVVTATRDDAGSNLTDLAVTPDGKDVIVASGAPYYHQVYALADLAQDGRYGTTNYPNAVAIAPDGTVAAGVADNTPDVYVFAQGAGSPRLTYDVAAGSLAGGGLAWAPDGSRLFAVSAGPSGDSPVLHVLVDPDLTGSALTATGPATAFPGDPVTVSGTLTSAEPFTGGRTLQVTRTDPAHPVGTPLADVPVAADGTYSFTDTPPGEGGVGYRVVFYGDGTHAGATATAHVTVARAATTLTVSGPASANRAAPVKFTGKLASPSLPVPAGAAVHISKKDAQHTVALPDARVAADGTFSFTDTPQVGGTNAYALTYAGDARHAASSASRQVQVSRAATAVSVTANAAEYTYGSAAKVTAHLGTTYNGRTVSVYAQPYGGAKALVRTGAVDAHGNLTVSYTVTRGTTFSVTFAGDYRYAPAAASHGVRAFARVLEGQRGYFTSAKVGSTTYRVYHHTKDPILGAGIAPAKYDECVAFTAQAYLRGAWRTIATAGCIRTDVQSFAWASLTGSHPTAYHYRFRTRFVHSATDLANMNTYGAWSYFEFRT